MPTYLHRGEGGRGGGLDSGEALKTRSKRTKEQVQPKNRNKNNTFQSDTPAGRRTSISFCTALESYCYLYLLHLAAWTWLIANERARFLELPASMESRNWFEDVCWNIYRNLPTFGDRDLGFNFSCEFSSGFSINAIQRDGPLVLPWGNSSAQVSEHELRCSLRLWQGPGWDHLRRRRWRRFVRTGNGEKKMLRTKLGGWNRLEPFLYLLSEFHFDLKLGDWNDIMTSIFEMVKKSPKKVKQGLEVSLVKGNSLQFGDTPRAPGGLFGACEPLNNHRDHVFGECWMTPLERMVSKNI